MRRALLAVCTAALVVPALAHAGVAHPNPAFVSPQVDYVEPLRGVDGKVASLPPLEHAVIADSAADRDWLARSRRDDLGGFLPELTGRGRSLVGVRGPSELPSIGLDGGLQVFGLATRSTTPPPDNGGQPVEGLGLPPTPPVPTNSNTEPPPNQGFGGRPSPGTGKTTTTTATTTTTQPGTTTTTTPTTTTTTTTPTTTPVPPPPAGNECGVAGLGVSSDLVSCRIQAVNMAPGQATFERITIRNESGAPFDLKVRVEGTQNALWNDLRLGIWELGTPAPTPLPALLLWTPQENALTTLPAGASVTYQIELALAPTAGNGAQGKSASIDFVWHAVG